jgi:hypothetical protein
MPQPSKGEGVLALALLRSSSSLTRAFDYADPDFNAFNVRTVVIATSVDLSLYHFHSLTPEKFFVGSAGERTFP